MLQALRSNAKETFPDWKRALVIAGSLAIGAALYPVTSIADADRIQAISTRADRVSGGDVLVKIDNKHDFKKQLNIKLNGKDVPVDTFKPGADPDALVGLVAGLKVGENVLAVQGAGTLHITNYPITGPITSGPHQVPFICQTQNFRLYPGGPFYGPASDANCSAPTNISYLYMPVGGTAFQPLPCTSTLPADVASTTTTTGATVKFIVRVETSTINRGIYQSAILHDPTSIPSRLGTRRRRAGTGG